MIRIFADEIEAQADDGAVVAPTSALAAALTTAVVAVLAGGIFIAGRASVVSTETPASNIMYSGSFTLPAPRTPKVDCEHFSFPGPSNFPMQRPDNDFFCM